MSNQCLAALVILSLLHTITSIAVAHTITRAIKTSIIRFEARN